MAPEEICVSWVSESWIFVLNLTPFTVLPLIFSIFTCMDSDPYSDRIQLRSALQHCKNYRYTSFCKARQYCTESPAALFLYLPLESVRLLVVDVVQYIPRCGWLWEGFPPAGSCRYFSNCGGQEMLGKKINMLLNKNGPYKNKKNNEEICIPLSSFVEVEHF